MKPANLFRRARFALPLLTGLLGTLLSLPAPAATVLEARHEFTATGDFDGDGREDIVIVDKAGGSYRVAHQLVAGQHTWASARASGLEDITGFSAGRLLLANRDALIFANPDANRLNLLAADSATVPGLPQAVYPSAIGPCLVVALDVGGVGNNLLDDLFTGVSANGTTPNAIGLMRNTAGAFSGLGVTLASATPVALGGAVTLKSGLPRFAGAMYRGGASDTFRVYDVSAGSLVAVLQTPPLAPGSEWAHARFDAGPLAKILFFQPGESNGTLRVRAVQEPLPGNYVFGSEAAFPLGSALRQVCILPQAVGARLLVIFEPGTTGRVYDFDGVNPPVPVQDLAAAAGQQLSGVAPFSQGDFTLFSAVAGSTTSSRFDTFRRDGSGYTASQGGPLPGVNVLSGLANLFQFESEPFVSTAPNLLRTLRAGDWTTKFNTQALPQVTATTESFLNSSNGLRNPTNVTVGTAHPQMHYGLVNQYLAPLSLFSLSRPVGDQVVEVHIQPPPGSYDASVTVTLSTVGAGQIFYRTSPNAAWTPYTAPLKLFADTTVSYYARPLLGTARSIIRHAAYQFTQAPDQLDSDGDGVPDYVEIGKGLNPRGGPDSDGDGYSDLDELLRDTNPASNSSMPTNYARLELRSSMDFVETPRPLDGRSNLTTLAASNMAARVHDVPGSLLRFSTTADLGVPGLPVPSVRLTNVIVDNRQRLLSIATDAHFDIAGQGTNESRGRELIGLRSVPETRPGLEVDYHYAGGASGVEATNWINAARSAYSNVVHVAVTEDLGIHDTLAALLVERKVAEILTSRGQPAGTNLTLFPFRTTDASRSTLTLNGLVALESLGTNGEPAWLIRSIHRTLTNGVLTPAPSTASLRAVTAEIYRLSSASNDVASLPSPVDTLRQFLATGVLHSNYLALSTLPPATLPSAAGEAAQLLASIAPRPTTNVLLTVRPDTFNPGCVLLDAAAGGASWALFLPDGRPFRLLENFSLPVGSVIQIFGFTDLNVAGCPGQPLQVVAVTLDSVPAVSVTDADGDLLPDDLELLLFGSLNQNAFGDADGDQFSNLQEAFDGTDLKDSLSKPQFLYNLNPPQVQLAALGGQWKLTWDWPAPYVAKIRFSVFSSADAAGVFAPVPVTPTYLGAGHFEAVLPAPPTPNHFFRVGMALR